MYPEQLALTYLQRSSHPINYPGPSLRLSVITHSGILTLSILPTSRYLRAALYGPAAASIFRDKMCHVPKMRPVGTVLLCV